MGTLHFHCNAQKLSLSLSMTTLPMATVGAQEATAVLDPLDDNGNDMDAFVFEAVVDVDDADETSLAVRARTPKALTCILSKSM